MGHNRLRTAERSRHARHFEVPQKLAHRLAAPIQIEAQQPPEMAQGPLRQVVLGMRRQTRVADPSHRGMAFERLGQRVGGGRLRPEAGAETAQTPQRVHGVERRRDRAEQHRVTPNPVDQLFLTADHAEAGVVVAADGLGGRVHHEIDALRQWLLAERRADRGVDHFDRTHDRAQSVEVDEVEARVGGGLGEDHLGLAGPDCGGPRARIGPVHHRHLNAQSGGHHA